MLITTFLSCKKKDNSDNLNNKSIWKSYKAASLFGLNAVTVDKDGNIWLGSQQNGVIKYSNNVWTNFNKDNGLPGNNITCIGLDKSGSKWFGTVNGLSKFDEIKWETFLNKDNETGYSVSGIVIDQNSNYWIGTFRGIYRLDASGWSKYTGSNGLIDDRIQALAIENKKTIWIGTINGVSSLE